MIGSVVDDEPVRGQIRTELDRTLFVEAGAGTGKTSALVGRIVELVATGTAALSQLAAITFTEAAASELRDRVRRALEELAATSPAATSPKAGAGPPDQTERADEGERAARAAQALEELDGAAITTLHGFAQRILAEHPFEAGLPPTFEVYDQIRSQVAFDERWSDFLDQLLDDPDIRLPLQRALVSGITLAHLRSLALEFDRNWDLVTDLDLSPEPPRPVDVAPVLAALAEAGALAEECSDADDKLLAHVVSLADWTQRLGAAADDLERLQLLTQAPRLGGGNRGRTDNWPGTKDDVLTALTQAETAATAALVAVQRQALGALLAQIRRLTLDGADQRRLDGTLEFHDLLVQARALVRRDPIVTAELHAAYTHLLIDEFQDTDPIQIELAVRIATDRADAGPDVDWRELPVPAGRLFFVGDPKQAIYRFRRADIGLFLDVRDAQVEAAVSLTRNHRSVPGILDWVNAVFEQLIGEGEPGVQAATSEPNVRASTMKAMTMP